MSGKIIIKPRRTKDGPSVASSLRPTPTSTDHGPSDSEPQYEDEDNQLDEPDNEAPTEDDQSEAGVVTADGPSQESLPKARGRPKGSVKSRGTFTPVGTPRPRGRPRGTGRGRPRGRGARGGGLVIRLPGRPGEEGTTPGAEGDAVETAEEPAAIEETAEAEGPMGGGKPFRKIHGKIYIIDGDEFISEEDPKGNTKIDPAGNLLGGRRFKAQTFVLPNRHPERLYMLAIDAARTSGFRDSLYYFRRNPVALKLNANQPEKDYLIEIGKLGSHLRTRSVTLITARSAFKLHGSKMLIDGRWVVDDYFEDKVLEDITAQGLRPGDLVGDLQDPQATNEASQLAAAEKQARNERAGSGPGMYRAGGPTTIFGGSGWGPYSDGPLNAVRKSLLTRDGLNEENWMFIAAQRTMEASDEWTKVRKETLKICGGILGDGAPATSPKRFAEDDGDVRDEKRRREEAELPLGVYEPHSGIVLYRSDTQPTRSRWEVVDEQKRVLGGTKMGNGAWGLAWVDTVMEYSGLGAEPTAD